VSSFKKEEYDESKVVEEIKRGPLSPKFIILMKLVGPFKI
jgi:hypothetical protein